MKILNKLAEMLKKINLILQSMLPRTKAFRLAVKINLIDILMIFIKKLGYHRLKEQKHR